MAFDLQSFLKESTGASEARLSEAEEALYRFFRGVIDYEESETSVLTSSFMMREKKNGCFWTSMTGMRKSPCSLEDGLATYLTSPNGTRSLPLILPGRGELFRISKRSKKSTAGWWGGFFADAEVPFCGSSAGALSLDTSCQN